MHIRIEFGRCRPPRWERIRDVLKRDLNHYDARGISPARLAEVAKNVERAL